MSRVGPREMCIEILNQEKEEQIQWKVVKFESVAIYTL